MVMEFLVDEECEVLEILQSSNYFDTSGARQIWLTITKLGDPAWCFTLYFPILFAFSPYRGLLFLLTACTAEAANGSLKWILHGNRPYWRCNNSIQQFPFTCETGPGNPSGHIMVSMAAWFAVLASKKRYKYKKLCFYVLVTFIFFCGMSRVFIGAHFPHQVVFGFVCGIAVGKVMVFSFARARDILNLRRLSHLISIIAFGVCAIYFGLLAVGYDPNWTIPLAKKHCANRNWIHIHTMPVISKFHAVGTLVGVFLSVRMFCSPQAQLGRVPLKPCRVLLLICAGVFGYATTWLLLPTSNAAIIYSFTFLRCVLSVIAVVGALYA